MEKAPASIIGLATAVPPHRLLQAEIMARANRLLPGVNREILAKMIPVYENAGVEMRYSCVPADWYEKPHGWKEKNRLYLENAIVLLEGCARDALDRAEISPNDIDAVVAVSSTGIATPSLDALLIEHMSLRRDVERLPLFGLGCAGGVIGLARAATIAEAEKGKCVLLVVVELCGLTFRRNDASKPNIVATALFGDGAAAVLLRSGDDGPQLEYSGEFSWPDSLDVMGWRVEEDGLGVVFSRDNPTQTRTDIREVALDFIR